MHNNFIVKNNKLLIGAISAEELIKKYGSPIYVYDAETIRRKYAELVDHITYPNLQIHYASKANSNPEILKLLRKEGAFIEVMSKGELNLAFRAGYKSSEIIYTCSNISKDELKFLINKKITINLDSLSQLNKFGELNPGKKISIRINQGIGAGGHKHLVTGGKTSKFGIDIVHIEEVKSIAQKYKLKIIGVHQHIGTDNLDEEIYIKSIKRLLKTAIQFKNLEFIDFGGGLSIPYRPGQKGINIEKLGGQLTTIINAFVENYGKKVNIKFEFGRFLVAESGYFLANVVDIKKNPHVTFVGLNAGMNQLVRPAMYDAYHKIINASNVLDREELVSVVGNICESADFFARDRKISKCTEGDVLAILDVGAYGYSMSSFYNGRPMPAEVLIDGNISQLIRKERSV